MLNQTEVTSFVELQICSLRIIPSLSHTFGLHLNITSGDSHHPGKAQWLFIASGLSDWLASSPELVGKYSGCHHPLSQRAGKEKS